jgi:hypothetical protein
MGIIYRKQKRSTGTEYAVNTPAFWLGMVLLPIVLLVSFLIGNRLLSFVILLLAALALVDTLPFKLQMAAANLSRMRYTKQGSIWSIKKPLTYRFRNQD